MFRIHLMKRTFCKPAAVSKNDTLVQGLFVRKIREYIAKQATARDELVDCTPQVAFFHFSHFAKDNLTLKIFLLIYHHCK